jgi:PAS domain S-box-containing protein
MPIVLVVEDEKLVARDIQQALTKLGHIVPECVGSGAEAIRAAERYRPDVALMDIKLRGEIDGIDAAATIRQRFDVPVVFLTAFVDDTTLRRAQTADPFGYLVKPFHEHELASTIEIALYKSVAERELRTTAQWFSTTLRSLAEGVITTNAEQRITFINASATRILGISDKSAIGQHVSQILHFQESPKRELPENPVAQALRERRSVELGTDLLLACEKGETLINASASPIIDDNGTILGAVVAFRDVSERKRLEERLALANQLAALGTMSAGLAHELANPLAYVMMNTDAAITAVRGLDERLQTQREDIPAKLCAELHKYVEQLLTVLQAADHGADRMRFVIKDLRTFSKIKDDDMSVIDVSKALSAAIRFTWNDLRHRARVVTEFRDAPPVRANEAKLSQLFVNLLINAAHSIPDGNAEDNVIKVVVYTDEKNRAVAEVHDTGCGIPAEQMPRIFEPFFTTKIEGGGMGLGLWLCREAAQSLGGALNVQSKVGQGSVFRLTLPGAEEEHVEISMTRQKAAVQRCKLLLVDDDKMVLTAMARSLERDHDVVTCLSGAEALQQLQSGRSFDAILCDLMMPQMNGVELYGEIARRHAGYVPRIIFLTGGAISEQARGFLEAIPNPRLSKPFRIQELLTVVADVVRGAPAVKHHGMTG